MSHGVTEKIMIIQTQLRFILLICQNYMFRLISSHFQVIYEFAVEDMY
jgi:hypothetical protein